MKRLILGIFTCLLCFSAPLCAEFIYDRDFDTELRLNTDGSIREWGGDGIQAPILVEQSTAGITAYIVGGATTTDSRCEVSASSIAFTTTGGLFPGTTSLVFAGTDKDTVGELVAYLNALSTSTIGAEGGIVATVPNGAYDGNTSSELTEILNVNVKSSTNTATLAIDSILGMTYTIAASTTTGNSIYLSNWVGNATFGSGTVLFNVYDGTATTDTQIRKETINSSGVDAIADLPATKDFCGSANTAMRIDMVGSAALTAAYMNITSTER